MYIIYALCVFTSNFAITVMTKTINSSYGWALFGNELYELCNVGSLYLGIKNLPFWKMITLHLIISALGYGLGQWLIISVL